VESVKSEVGGSEDQMGGSASHSLRLARFATTSIICTVLTQILLWLFVGVLGWDGGPANIVAVLLTTVPSYLFARHWVWRSEAVKGNTGRDVGIFWATSLLGLLLSTLLASAFYRVSPHAWAVSLANLLAFGALWYARYSLFHTYVFAPADDEGSVHRR
jgi:putative flippase GtrA